MITKDHQCPMCHTSNTLEVENYKTSKGHYKMRIRCTECFYTSKPWLAYQTEEMFAWFEVECKKSILTCPFCDSLFKFSKYFPGKGCCSNSKCPLSISPIFTLEQWRKRVPEKKLRSQLKYLIQEYCPVG